MRVKHTQERIVAKTIKALATIPTASGSINSSRTHGVPLKREMLRVSEWNELATKTLSDLGYTWRFVVDEKHPPNQLLEYDGTCSATNRDAVESALAILVFVHRLTEISNALVPALGPREAEELVGVVAHTGFGLGINALTGGHLLLSRYYESGLKAFRARKRRDDPNRRWRIAEAVQARIAGGSSIHAAISATAGAFKLTVKQTSRLLASAAKNSNWVPKPPGRGRPKKQPPR